MRIISKTKDYYDFVQNTDTSYTNIVYDRDAEFKQVIKFHEMGVDTLDIPVYRQHYEREVSTKNTEWDRITCKRYNIIICGKIYKVDHFHYSMAYSLKSDDRYEFVEDYEERNWWSVAAFRYTMGEHIPAFDVVSRAIKQPIFTYVSYTHDGRNYVEVGATVPNLGMMGFGKLLPPQQLFQDIEFYFNNVIYPESKRGVPPPMSSLEKIKSHGFDTKQSFRHRK